MNISYLLFLLAIIYVIPAVVLVGIVLLIIYLNKRLTESSWFRKFLAVIVGISVEITAEVATLITIKLSFILRPGLDLVQQGLPDEIFAEELQRLINTVSQIETPPLLVILFLLLSGYVTGKIARQNEIVFGFITGLIRILIIILSSSIFGLPLQISLSSFIWLILGGYLAFFQRTRNHNNIDAGIQKAI